MGAQAAYERIAADMHPDYMSTKFAAGLGAPVVEGSEFPPNLVLAG